MACCFIRISMNNLKDIHNVCVLVLYKVLVVLSGFQWTIWRIYTTSPTLIVILPPLFYQDFNEQFEGYTQLIGKVHAFLIGCFIRISMNNLKDIHNSLIRSNMVCTVVLSGFQWTIWRIYTTNPALSSNSTLLFYQDFNEQFEGYTQPSRVSRLTQ